MRNLAFVSGVLVMTAACAADAGTLVTPDELARRDTWVKASFEKLTPDAPQPGLVVIANNDGVTKNHRNGKPLSIADKQSGLVLRWVAVEYAAFPTVEWTLYFKNTGAQDTPILSDILALDTGFRRGPQGEFLLHHHAGSPAAMDD